MQSQRLRLGQEEMMTRAKKRARDDSSTREGYPRDLERVDRFLSYARLGLSRTRTAQIARVPEATVRGWFGEADSGDLLYPAFVEEFMARSVERLEAVADCLWIGATEDPKLALEVLRTVDPDNWRQVRREEQTGKDGGPIEISNADYDEAMAQLFAAKDGNE